MGFCQSKQQPIKKDHSDKKSQSQINHYGKGIAHHQEKQIVVRKHEATSQTPAKQVQSIPPELKVSYDGRASFNSDLEIPITKSVQIDKQTPLTQSQTRNSIQQKQQERKPEALVNSIDNVLIPESESIKRKVRSSSFLQRQQERILRTDYSSLQLYKNFSNQKLTNQKGQLVCKSLFTCFCRLIFGLIARDDQKLQRIKNQIISLDEFVGDSNISASVLEHGQVQEPQEIKKLFLEYIVKLLKNQTAIHIISNYYVMSGILELAVISYVKYYDTNIEAKYDKQQFDNQFFQIVSKQFQIRFQQTDRLFKFKDGDKQLIIQVSENGQKCVGQIK